MNRLIARSLVTSAHLRADPYKGKLLYINFYVRLLDKKNKILISSRCNKKNVTQGDPF